jgi:ribonucleoside-diphosphate reductase alpha chain
VGPPHGSDQGGVRRSSLEQPGCEVPKHWSQLATNVVVSKYFYGENGTPERERSVRQLIHRVTRTIADWGIEDGYFASAEDGERFYRELTWLCLHQHGAFNSPVWFNVGLYHQYGVKGAQCNWHWNAEAERVQQPENPYEYPQGSACFIQSVQDNMEDIMELARSEAMLFKFGSGTGTDLSTLRSYREKLSGGGKPSGPLSFMRVYDQIAAVVKSGGKTRRAAKMQSIKVWHPDVMDFIECKAKEERKARVLIEKGGYEANFNGEAYSSILFQNANLSVRVTDEFMQAVVEDKPWATHWVTDPSREGPSWPARDVLARMAECAWQCGDPGVQYDTTVNRWHTCPNSGRINASNPCVTAETMVSTAEGYRRIGDLVGREVILVDQHGVRRPVTKVFPTGRKPVYRLITQSGYQLRLTADHRVWTINRGDVPACELTRDDRIALNPVGFGTDELDVELAEVVGLMVGDGCVSRSKIDREPISTLTMDSDLEATIVAEVCDRLNSYKSEDEDGRGQRPIEVGSGESATATRLATGSRRIANLLETYAVLDAGSSAKRLKDSVFQLARTAVAGILRGLFTADGCVYNYGEKSQSVSLDSTSQELLRQVQLLLLGFGIKSELYANRRAGPLVALLPDCHGGTKEYSVQQMHSLRISRSSRVRFEREIGFWPGSHKQAKLEALNQAVGTYLDRMDDRVASLEPDGEEEVFDLTEPVTEHFGANGLVVHNCSEYMFLDDTACNLASVNLMKFRRDDGAFDFERYQNACRIYFIAQEILVDHASYPTRRIAENSHKFRPLGLGYSNLGSLLMSNGIAYDSDAARGWCGAVTALLHGAGNLASVELAAAVGPFDGYEANRDPMLGVMQMHRDAVEQIDPACPEYLRDAARALWNEVLEQGRRFGFRNAQATVLAPTGTISFLMDCDTTGIEPDIALVKYKQLAGGGMMKIVNNTVPLALQTLGYDEPRIKSILDYIDKNDTIEGASDLADEHLPVFDCAFQPRSGKRSIAWRAHVTMMAAAQPFLSGAISKTVNMPRDTTPADIADAYLEGWRLGLKALAIYRDGSKESQPLSTSTESDKAAAKQLAAPRRERLPDTRKSITHKFSVAGHEGYLTVGLYDDGRPGELFITMAKEGSTIGGLMDCFGTAVSMSWQYGVPLEVYVNKFAHTRFEPMGHTKNPDIRLAKSIVDYIFRWLGITFLPGYREANRGPLPDEPPAAARSSPGAEDVVSETRPAAKKVGGLTDSQGSATEPLRPRSGQAANGHHGANGNGNGAATAAAKKPSIVEANAALLQRAGVALRLDPAKVVTNRDEQFASFQLDAPSCDNCGAITVRNGNCYLCHNCGNSMGCS